jgi:hypothetical protein
MKPFIILLFIVPFAIASLAQTDPLRDQLNSVFANVDKSKVPTVPSYINLYLRL